MTTRDAVRNRLGLGRLLPLGTAADAAWLTEEAAVAALRAAAARVPDVALGRVRLSLAAPEAAAVSPVPSPPSALPPGDLRIEAGFRAGTTRPLPLVASQLREVLWTVASQQLDLLVQETDLQVTGLFEPAAEPLPEDRQESSGSTTPPGGPAVHPEDPVARAASTAPGVAHLTATLGSAVHLATDHLRVEVAIAPGHRPLTVVGAVRQAVLGARGDDGRPVVVLVTNVSAS